MKKNDLMLPTWNTLDWATRVDCFKTSQVRTSNAYSSFKPHKEDPSLINASQKQNFKFQTILVTLPNNTEAGKRVSATDSSNRIRPERTKEVGARRRAYF